MSEKEPTAWTAWKNPDDTPDTTKATAGKAGAASAETTKDAAQKPEAKAPGPSIEDQIAEAMQTDDGIDKKELIALVERYSAERGDIIKSAKDAAGKLLAEALKTMVANGMTIKNAKELEFFKKYMPTDIVVLDMSGIEKSVAEGKTVTLVVKDGQIKDAGFFENAGFNDDLFENAGEVGVRLKKDAYAKGLRKLEGGERTKMEIKIAELASRVLMTPSMEGDPKNARRTEESYVGELLYLLEHGKPGNAKTIPNVRMKDENQAKEIAAFLRSIVDAAKSPEAPVVAPVAVIAQAKVDAIQRPADKPAEKANYEASKRFLNAPGNESARKNIEEFLTRNPAFKDAFENLVKDPKIQTVTQLQLAIGIPAGKADVKYGRADGIFGGKTSARLADFLKNNETTKAIDEAAVLAAIEKTKKIRADRRSADAALAAKKKEAEAAEAGAVAPTEPKAQTRQEAEAESMRKLEALKAAKEAEIPKNKQVLGDLQRSVMTNLKPLGGDVFTVDHKFLKDGFTSSVFFKFDTKNGEWLWNGFNNPDESKSSSWNKVSKLETATVDGKSDIGAFGFSTSAQETVIAILAAQKKAREFGLKLAHPNAPSPIAAMIPR